jgi:hypothetical protein
LLRKDTVSPRYRNELNMLRGILSSFERPKIRKKPPPASA